MVRTTWGMPRPLLWATLAPVGQGHHEEGLACLCMVVLFLGGRGRHRDDVSVWQGCGVSQPCPEKLPSVLITRLAKAQLDSTSHSSKEGEEGRFTLQCLYSL